MATAPHRKDPNATTARRTRREQAVLRAAAMASRSFDDDEDQEEEEADDRQSPLHQQVDGPPQPRRLTPKAQGRNDGDEGQQSGGLPPSQLVTPPTVALTAPSYLPPDTDEEEDPLSAPTSPSPGKKGVPHIYHDYSQVPDQPGYVRKKTGGVTQPFPEKLYEMLESEALLQGDIVEWLPHGRAFIVRRPKEFTDHIMPKYFRQTKLTSFQRQLNLYGFRRLTQSPDGGAYYHEMFLRGKPALCYQMKRQKVKGTGHKQPADANTEPNLYALPSVRCDDDAGPQQFFLDSSGNDQEYSPTNVNDQEYPPTAMLPMPQTLSPHVGAMSPGIGSVTGAAHLLRHIASGDRNRGLPPLPFVGLPPSAAMAPPDPSLVRAPPPSRLAESGDVSQDVSLLRSPPPSHVAGSMSLQVAPPRGAFFLRQHFFTTDAIEASRSSAAAVSGPAGNAVDEGGEGTSVHSSHPKGAGVYPPEDSATRDSPEPRLSANVNGAPRMND